MYIVRKGSWWWLLVTMTPINPTVSISPVGLLLVRVPHCCWGREGEAHLATGNIPVPAITTILPPGVLPFTTILPSHITILWPIYFTAVHQFKSCPLVPGINMNIACCILNISVLAIFVPLTLPYDLWHSLVSISFCLHLHITCPSHDMKNLHWRYSLRWRYNIAITQLHH